MNCLNKSLLRSSLRAGAYEVDLEPRDLRPREVKYLITGHPQQMRDIVTIKKAETKWRAK